MLLEFCTQYANKFGKLSSGHRTGKGQFSFQSQRRAMPKNVQTTAQLHVCGNFHIISDDSKPVFKTLQLGFNSTWTENFQMYKLHLEKAEESEIKLPTAVVSSKKQEISRKTFTSASLKKLKPLTVWISTNWKDWCWSWSSNTLATWCEELTHWKSCWCWERLRAALEGGNRGWDGWMAPSSQWTWIWTNSGS